MALYQKVHSFQAAEKELAAATEEAAAHAAEKAEAWALGGDETAFHDAVAAHQHVLALREMAATLKQLHAAADREVMQAPKREAKQREEAARRELDAARAAHPLNADVVWRRTVEAHPAFAAYQRGGIGYRERVHRSASDFGDADARHMPEAFARRFAQLFDNSPRRDPKLPGLLLRDEEARTTLVRAIEAELPAWLRNWPAARLDAERKGHAPPSDGPRNISIHHNRSN